MYNENVVIKKNFLTLGYESNKIWEANTNGYIYTSSVNPQTGLIQQSQLKAIDIEVDENKRIATFLRDINSMSNAQAALIEGDFLQGFYLTIKLVYLGSNFAWIYLPYVTWSVNQRNV